MSWGNIRSKGQKFIKMVGMDSDHNFSQNLVDQLESSKPRDEREGWERAVFLATAMAALSSNILSSYIRYCIDGAEEGSVQTPFQVADLDYTLTTKEILTLNLWMIICEECGPDVPEWFRDYIYTAFQVADELCKEPAVKTVFEQYPMENGPIAVSQTLSMIVCHRLNLGATKPEAALALGDFILDCSNRRRDLLKFSLTESIMALDAWVADMKPQAI